MQTWMIYGANGYSGYLIAKEAKRLGMHPILAGRSEKIEQVAAELGFTARRFDVADHAATRAALEGVALVLNCAGPFSRTAKSMITACLEVGAHYLDITGEYPVFEYAHSLHEAAVEKGIVLCPGVGFDVIPTDCVAVALKRAMPDAISLTLGFDSKSSLSPGTAKTMIEGLPAGGMIRRDGKLISVPNAYLTREIDFGYGRKWSMTIPWGDISTAFFSTGIPNISVYVPASRKISQWIRRMNWFRRILGWAWVQRLMLKQVEQRVKGPTDLQRAKLRTAVWGEVSDAHGKTCTARIETENGYTLTVDGSLTVVRWLQTNEASIKGGYYTPATLIGPELVAQLSGSSKLQIS